MQPIQNPNGINPFDTGMPVILTQLTDSVLSEDEKILERLFEELESMDPDIEPEKCDLCLDKIENHIRNSSSIKEKDERLSDVLELKQRRKGIAYFANHDRQRFGEMGTIACNSISKGTLSFTSPLVKAETTVTAIGIAKYSAEERERRLQQIAFLKMGTQQNLGPGCSIILNLIADELREGFLAFQRSKSYRNQNVKSGFSFIKSRMDGLIGFLSIAAASMGRFQGGFQFFTGKHLTHEFIQNDFVSSRKEFLSDDGIFVEESSPKYF